MKYKLFAFILALCLCLTACARQSAQAAPSTSPSSSIACEILLSGNSASIDGEGAVIKDGVLIISKGGTYSLSGKLDEGRIIVNAPDEQVTLALNGVEISCSYSIPIYIYKAIHATILLVENSVNTLSDGESYSFDDEFSSLADTEPNACLYSKQDLLIEGTGKLEVNASYKNGITSKDTLQIYEASLSVSALNNGINGKDSNSIDSADIAISCGGHGIVSTQDNDESLGWIKIANSNIAIDSGEDGIHASTNLDISGGTFSIASGDDAIHADGDLTISSGDIDITSSYEGIEASNILISGGSISIVSDDDGINAAGGADASGFGGMDAEGWGGMHAGGFGGMRAQGGMPQGERETPPEDFAHDEQRTPPEQNMAQPFEASGSYSVEITGGDINISAGGDGIDSNGSLIISGGTIVVCSGGNADCALDYQTTMSIENAVLFAASLSSMANAQSYPSQNALALSFDSRLDAGQKVSFSFGGKDCSFTLTRPATSAIFTSSELIAGDNCIISVDSEELYNLSISDGLTSGGASSFAGRGRIPVYEVK